MIESFTHPYKDKEYNQRKALTCFGLFHHLSILIMFYLFYMCICYLPLIQPQHQIILDCFVGAGTTASVAQKLGRRWICCDINKGAVQTTAKRLQKIMNDQIGEMKEGRQGALVDIGEKKAPKPTQRSLCVFRVNDYDLQVQQDEAVKLACEYIGVETSRSDTYFNGSLGKSLVKIPLPPHLPIRYSLDDPLL